MEGRAHRATTNAIRRDPAVEQVDRTARMPRHRSSRRQGEKLHAILRPAYAPHADRRREDLARLRAGRGVSKGSGSRHVLYASLHIGLEEAVAVAAFGLGAVEGNVSMPDQLLGIRRTAMGNGNADADPDFHAVFAKLIVAAEGEEDTRG